MTPSKPVRVAPLWVRAVRSRPSASLLLFALSTVAVLTAVLGPLLIRAVRQSTLQDAVAAGGVDRTSISVSADLPVGASYPEQRAVLQTVFSDATAGPRRGLWAPVETLVVSSANLTWVPKPGRTDVGSRVNAADLGCPGYPITAGQCPTHAGEALLSQDDARRFGVAVGRVVEARPPNAPAHRLVVVGTFNSHTATVPLATAGSLNGSLAGVTGDPVIVAADEPALKALPITMTGRLRLRGGLDLTSEPLARQSLELVEASLVQQDQILRLDTQLPTLLTGVDAQAASAAVLLGVAAVQAVACAFVGLAIVLQRLGRARGAEWGVGRLRGVPRLRWLASVYVEPAVALLAGLPVGLLAGTATAVAATRATLRPGTPVEVWRWPVLLSAAAAVIAALVALVGVSLRSVRRPLVELITESGETRQVGRVTLVAQSAVVLLAAATLYELLGGGVLTSRPQLTLLAPALFALALAVLAVQGTVMAVRRVTTRPPRSVTALVVGRQAARTRSALNPAIVIAVGVALAVFTGQVQAMSVRNQELRAVAVTGADTVLHVAVPVGTDLTSAVRRADPTGRFAMAVQERAASSDGGTSRVVAVDSARLAAVAPQAATWAGVGDLGSALHPTTAPPIVLRGSVVRAAVTGVRVRVTPSATGGSASPGAQLRNPDLILVVQVGGRWQGVDLGALGLREARLTGSLPCPSGCRLVGLGTQGSTGSAYTVDLTVASLITNAQPAAETTGWLTAVGRWRQRVGNWSGPDPIAAATPSVSASGLRVAAFDQEGSSQNLVAPTDTDDPLPAVLAPDLQVEPFPGMVATAVGTGLDGQSQLLHVLGRASILPRALNDGVLVDLRDAAALSDPSQAEAQNEVWLAARAPAGAERRLAAVGVRVQSRELLATTRHALLQSATTRGAAVARTLGYAALLLSLLSLVAARLADASRRRADWRALSDGGLCTRTLRWLVGVEIAAPALLGAVLGMAGGLGAIAVAAARLPLVDLTTPGPPLDLHVSWAPVGVLAAAVIVAVLAVAAVGARFEAHRGRAG